MRAFYAFLAMMNVFYGVLCTSENIAFASEPLPNPRWSKTFKDFARLSKDGKRIIRRDESDLILEDVESGNLIKKFTFDSEIRGIFPSTHWVIVELLSGDPVNHPRILVSLDTLERVDIPAFYQRPEISDDGQYLVGWKTENRLEVIDIWRYRVVFSTEVARDYSWLPHPVLSHDNSLLAVPTVLGGPIELWDITMSRLVSRIDFAGVRGIAFSPRGKHLLTYATGLGGAVLWDTSSGSLIQTYSNGLTSVVESAKFLEHEEYPFLFSNGNLLFLNDQGTAQTHGDIKRNSDYNVLDISPTGDSIFIYGCNPLNGRGQAVVAKRKEGVTDYRFTEFTTLINYCGVSEMTYSGSGEEVFLYVTPLDGSRTSVSIWDIL